MQPAAAAAEKYASLERISPTACVTLAVVLPISAALHMPDVLFILSSFGTGLLFFLGWQAALRQVHVILSSALFLSGFILAFAEVALPSIHNTQAIFLLQGLGTPALSFFFFIWAHKQISRNDNTN